MITEKLSKLTLEEAERSLSQEELEFYCYCWRNTSFRFSTEMIGYQDDLFDPKNPTDSYKRWRKQTILKES